jgi:tRNA-splicing ligase RtcB
MVGLTKLRKLDAYRWELPMTAGMRVPGLFYASEDMLDKLERERVAEQVANVAALPGIVRYSLAMPDAHWGYGMPIGGVAAMDAAEGVISPGAVGYDISCGVRLLRSDLRAADVAGRARELAEALFKAVPSGVGVEGHLRLGPEEIRRVFLEGARWAVTRGYGEGADLEVVEDNGRETAADPERPSERAVERGRGQLGTLGSGNHFVELQEVDEIYDPGAAAAFGLFAGQFTMLIHTGSRGCGYQICEDFLRSMQSAARRYGISLPDRQLCCAPFMSSEGQAYFGAMCAGANFARANRQVITHFARQAIMRCLGRDAHMRVVYDVAHNLCKVEEHEVNGVRRKLCVHRKGATRAFPAGRPEVPKVYRAVGQPVLVPGSMGTHSYVLIGTETAMKETFGTTAHGAGRAMSRSQALKRVQGRDLLRQLKNAGIEARTDSLRGLAEEAPFAYKDVAQVVEVCHEAGISRKVARLRPFAVIKG